MVPMSPTETPSTNMIYQRLKKHHIKMPLLRSSTVMFISNLCIILRLRITLWLTSKRHRPSSINLRKLMISTERDMCIAMTKIVPFCSDLLSAESTG